MRALLCLLFLLAAPLAHADCAGSAMTYWPADGQTLAPSGLLYVEGYGTDRARLDAVVRAELVSGKTRVELERVVEHSGHLEVKQFVFRARSALPVGSRWRLKLTSKDRTWSPTRWIRGKMRPVEWAVAAQPTPAWTGAPTTGKRTFAPFGCGPAIYQQVNLPISAEAGLVEVALVQGEKTQRYAIPAGKTISVGHGMCSGEFYVGGDAGEYTATFALLDARGVRTPAPKALRFPAVNAQNSDQ